LQSILEEQKHDRSPAHIALGIQGAWIVLWSNGSRTLNLRNAYTTLASSDQLLCKEGWLLFTALNSFQEDQYFVVDETGGCSYKTSLPSKNDSALLHEITSEYMRMRAKQNVTTFSHPFIRDGVTTQVTIAPDSYRETGKMRSLMDRWIERRNLPVRNDVAFVGEL
jgi:hypothetical protein